MRLRIKIYNYIYDFKICENLINKLIEFNLYTICDKNIKIDSNNNYY